ncbi:MAG: hypothetical protein JWN93_3155, partial [Hyphomicrobiales bacterium]|nr:hypothetical protein [Hyphomicrobiales bacterium]
MNLEFSRSRGAAGPREAEPVQWLAPSRIRTRRPGDTLVVLLASALLILLGVAALAVRFGSSPSEATANTLATLPTAVMRAPAPAAANAPRPEAQEKIAARNEPPPQDAIVATPIAPVSLAKLDPPITGSTAISAVAPATARVKVDAAAFAPVAIPSVPAVRRDEAETASAPALTPRIEPA